MLEILLFFFFGVGILLLSTRAFVNLAGSIALIFRIPPLFLAITLVAIGTSLPELVVSFFAALNRDTGLAFGNIIGSNIVNVFFVFAVGILFGNVKIEGVNLRRNTIVLVGVTILFAGVYVFGFVTPFWPGVILLSLAIAYSISEYIKEVSREDHAKRAEFASQDLKDRGVLRGREIVFVGILLTGIVLGGTMIVASVEEISVLTGIGTTALGLGLIAIATSLPELFTTIFAQRQKQSQITIGNILGSNIFNLSLIGGIILLFSRSAPIGFTDWMFLFLATFSFAILMFFYRGKFIPRKVGAVFLTIFISYILTLGGR